MNIDENEFFRQATLRICGSLDVKKALSMALNYLQEFIPIDRIFLEIFDEEFQSMRTIVVVTAEGGIETDLLTPLSKEAKLLLRSLQPSIDTVAVFSDPMENLIAREMLRFHGIQAASLMNMPLITESGRAGGLVFISESDKKHSQRHVDLMSLLIEPFTIAVSNALEHREVLQIRKQLAESNQYLKEELQRESKTEIIGSDYGLKNVMTMVQQVATMESPVYLSGETGTGKEVIAAAIHDLSNRRNGPFIKVNCGAIPGTLIDSELFGHEKGAFTGAIEQKIGRFERANLGTIFLDEIGELSLEAQVRLLRVLQEKEIERIGGSRTIKLDIRIIAATHRDLKSMIKEGRFREDLYFRLQIFPIEIPPLRERKEDIPALVQHFIQQKTFEMKLEAKPELSADSMDRLMSYNWPGNVRELENSIERSIILHRGEPLRFSDIQVASPPPTQETLKPKVSSDMTLDGVISNHIRTVLDISRGRVEGKGGAAEILAINSGTLRNRMRKLKIPFGRKATK